MWAVILRLATALGQPQNYAIPYLTAVKGVTALLTVPATTPSAGSTSSFQTPSEVAQIRRQSDAELNVAWEKAS